MSALTDSQIAAAERRGRDQAWQQALDAARAYRDEADGWPPRMLAINGVIDALMRAAPSGKQWVA